VVNGRPSPLAANICPCRLQPENRSLVHRIDSVDLAYDLAVALGIPLACE
jgi:hypothetical protein